MRCIAALQAVYWVAAVVALASAVEAAVELARGRSPVLAAWALSMTAMSASLAVAAVVPAAARGGPGPAASACASLGIAGTWALAESLATRAGGARRLADMVTVPLLGGACALLLLLGLCWAGRHGAGGAGLAEPASVMVQLTLMAYYVPGLYRIAVLARQRAESVPGYWARMVMRAVCACAGAWLVLAVARSVVLAARGPGVRAGGPVIPVLCVLQGVAVTCVVGGLAAGPVIMAVSARRGSRLACWRHGW